MQSWGDNWTYLGTSEAKLSVLRRSSSAPDPETYDQLTRSACKGSCLKELTSLSVALNFCKTRKNEPDFAVGKQRHVCIKVCLIVVPSRFTITASLAILLKRSHTPKHTPFKHLLPSFLNCQETDVAQSLSSMADQVRRLVWVESVWSLPFYNKWAGGLLLFHR